MNINQKQARAVYLFYCGWIFFLFFVVFNIIGSVVITMRHGRQQ